MNRIINKWHIHCDITTVCHSSCLYCSRYMRHTKKEDRKHMPLEYFKKAFDTLDDWPNRIGLMGGEPTLHPQFPEICEYMRSKKHPNYPDIRTRYSLFTAGGPAYEKYRNIIAGTFHYCEVFEHNDLQTSVCKHQPTTLAINDMVKDEQLKQQLINDCWVDHTWCATITEKGAFFCEVAAAIDRVTNGPGGFALTSDWWNKDVDDPEYLAQVERSCKLCGMPVPVERETLASQKERVSRGLFEKLKACGSPSATEDKCIIVEDPFTIDEMLEASKTWNPGQFRQDKYGE